MCSMPKKMLTHTPYVDPTARIIDSQLGAYTEVGPNTKIQETVVGDYSYIMENGDVIYSSIGKFCSIASMVRLNPGNHPMHRATQHHFTYRSEQFGLGEDDPQVFASRRSRPVEVGHDVWVGYGAIILPGVRIGTGAVVGAGSVVTKNIEPYTIVAGVPAKPIRKRFSDIIQDALLRIRWWDWSHEQLKQTLPEMRNMEVEEFVSKYDIADEPVLQEGHG